jgi:MFS transporter, DHA1 family, multidrug resistance protein
MQSDATQGQSGWRVTLAVVLLAQFTSAVGFSMVFPFLPLYVNHLGSTMGMSVELAAGLVIGGQALTMAVAAPFWGVVADRYGRKLMVMRAMFGGAVLMGLMALVTSAEQLILLRMLQGVITGTVAANNAMAASVVPRDRIGFAMGALQVGQWAGVAAGPLLGGLLADAFGFAFPFYLTALLLFVAGVLVYFGIQEAVMPRRKKDAPQMSIMDQWKAVLTAEGVTPVYLLRFMSGVGRTMIIPIAPLFVVSLLPTEVAGQSIYAGLVMSVSSGAGTISGIYLGRLGDRIGHRIVLLGCAVMATVFYIPQVFVSSVEQLLLLQAITGLASGGLIAAPAALLAQYTRQGEEGVAYGFDNALFSGARAVAPMVGAGVAALGGLRATFAAAALLHLSVVFITHRLLPAKPKSDGALAYRVAGAGD